MLAQQERTASPLHAVTQRASSPPAAQLTRADTVKAGLTQNACEGRSRSNPDSATGTAAVRAECCTMLSFGYPI